MILFTWAGKKNYMDRNQIDHFKGLGERINSHKAQGDFVFE